MLSITEYVDKKLLEAGGTMIKFPRKTIHRLNFVSDVKMNVKER